MLCADSAVTPQTMSPSGMSAPEMYLNSALGPAAGKLPARGCLLGWFLLRRRKGMKYVCGMDCGQRGHMEVLLKERARLLALNPELVAQESPQMGLMAWLEASSLVRVTRAGLPPENSGLQCSAVNPLNEERVTGLKSGTFPAHRILTLQTACPTRVSLLGLLSA